MREVYHQLFEGLSKKEQERGLKRFAKYFILKN